MREETKRGEKVKRDQVEPPSPCEAIDRALDTCAVCLYSPCKCGNNVVSSPNHYTRGGIQPIEFIRANGLNFCEGNVIKYVSRHRFKNGVEDLKKARQYLDWLIEEYKA